MHALYATSLLGEQEGALLIPLLCNNCKAEEQMLHNTLLSSSYLKQSYVCS